MRHVLVLGGTAPAREVARRLAAGGCRVTSSLAGRVRESAGVAGEVRVGGFGGTDGLAAWMREHDVEVLVDATHPFAATMSAHAAHAAAATGVPLVRLDRPGWEAGPGDDWHAVPDLAAAARVADGLGDRLLVTTGRQGAAAFAQVAAWCLMRSIEPPDPPLPARHEVLLDRGPFTLEGELALLRGRDIEVVVTKNSGGGDVRAKLDAARDLGLPVVMVARPRPPRVAGVDLTVVPDAAGAARAALARA
ncbi:cobalt-precorrin-6A reductase [Agilicoccus flavus]|uniref:cobalt-precorrin-6A reductase n=1 Tax=Agilicoccus flavus TaxID=2775968 RepID=UPI001CF657F1|nr:cobalt-precorrin-6A reductase [Agilicoccus flavus]